MNKQELIKHIEKVKGDKPHYREQYHLGRWQTIESMLELIDQLDEPEITEEQAWEVIERANHQHIAPAYVWIYKKAIQKGLTPTDITGLEENPTISKKETVEVPQTIGAYIKKERGENTLGNIADEIYNSEESWSNLSEEYKWMRLNFTLFARAWLDGYTIEPPKKHRVKVSGELYFVRYDELEVVVIRDSAPRFIERAKLFDNKEEAEKVAGDVNGYVEELPEDEAMKLIEGWKGNE